MSSSYSEGVEEKDLILLWWAFIFRAFLAYLTKSLLISTKDFHV